MPWCWPICTCHINRYALTTKIRAREAASRHVAHADRRGDGECHARRGGALPWKPKRWTRTWRSRGDSPPQRDPRRWIALASPHRRGVRRSTARCCGPGWARMKATMQSLLRSSCQARASARESKRPSRSPDMAVVSTTTHKLKGGAQSVRARALRASGNERWKQLPVPAIPVAVPRDACSAGP